MKKKLLMMTVALLIGLASTVAKADCTVVTSADGSSVSVECTDGSFDGTFDISG